MKQHNKRSLESFRIFPWLAWALVIVFAVFVYHLANGVEQATEQLQAAQQEKLNISTEETAVTPSP